MSVQPAIRLRLFGRFSAVGDGVPLRITSRKGIALLAYLALHPEHTAGREQLATLLWGDRPDQQARLNLRQCMLSLRNALAPATNNLFILEDDAIGGGIWWHQAHKDGKLGHHHEKKTQS